MGRRAGAKMRATVWDARSSPCISHYRVPTSAVSCHLSNIAGIAYCVNDCQYTLQCRFFRDSDLRSLHTIWLQQSGTVPAAFCTFHFPRCFSKSQSSGSDVERAKTIPAAMPQPASYACVYPRPKLRQPRQRLIDTGRGVFVVFSFVAMVHVRDQIR